MQASQNDPISQVKDSTHYENCLSQWSSCWSNYPWQGKKVLPNKLICPISPCFGFTVVKKKTNCSVVSLWRHRSSNTAKSSSVVSNCRSAERFVPIKQSSLLSCFWEGLPVHPSRKDPSPWTHFTTTDSHYAQSNSSLNSHPAGWELVMLIVYTAKRSVWDCYFIAGLRKIPYQPTPGIKTQLLSKPTRSCYGNVITTAGLSALSAAICWNELGTTEDYMIMWTIPCLIYVGSHYLRHIKPLSGGLRANHLSYSISLVFVLMNTVFREAIPSIVIYMPTLQLFWQYKVYQLTTFQPIPCSILLVAEDFY